MSKKPFLVIIDTTEARMSQSGVGVGILNAHIILAETADQAKLTLLEMFRPNVKNAVRDYLYAYEVSDVEQNLIKYNQNIFSFIPLQGGRPPRQAFNAETFSKASNNVTLQPNQQQVQQQAPKPQQTQQRVVANTNVPNDIRGRGFNNIEQSPPEVKETVSAEQAQILTSLGVTPQRFGGDEGSLPRVNSSIGGNANLRNTIAPTRTSDVLTEDKASILRSVGVSLAGIADGNGGTSVINEEQTEVPQVDKSLTEVDSNILSDEEIARLKNEIKET
jgi:hypothetical protein